ncbi:MAG: hypothetical protein ACK56F_14020, partial [bacterium]
MMARVGNPFRCWKAIGATPTIGWISVGINPFIGKQGSLILGKSFEYLLGLVLVLIVEGNGINAWFLRKFAVIGVFELFN